MTLIIVLKSFKVFGKIQEYNIEVRFCTTEFFAFFDDSGEKTYTVITTAHLPDNKSIGLKLNYMFVKQHNWIILK